MFKPTYLYVKTHSVTGLKYFGKTTNSNPSKHKGSGVVWMKHIEKHGYDVSTEILGLYSDPEELKQAALEFSKKNNIVESAQWANLIVEDGFTCGDTLRYFTEESRKKMSSANTGVNNNQSKLSEKQVIDIYYSCESPDYLAAKYSIGVGQIFGIKRKIYYKNLTKHISNRPGMYEGKKVIRPILTVEDVKQIFIIEESYSYFKEKYKASPQVVKNIKLRKTYKKITKDLKCPGAVKKYKLTNQDTVDIFKSTEELDILAERYGVHRETIRNIRSGRTRVYFKDEF